jgi:translation elongation factor EF-Tu-like GTPase
MTEMYRRKSERAEAGETVGMLLLRILKA